MSQGYQRKGPRNGGVLYQMQRRNPDGTWDDSGRTYRRRHDAIAGHTTMAPDVADHYRLAVVRLQVVETVPGRVLSGHGKSVRLAGKPTADACIAHSDEVAKDGVG